MKWFTDKIGLTTAEENTPTQAEDIQKDPSRIQQRTKILTKIKNKQDITSKEIHNFQSSGGKLDEIINKETKETLLDRAIKLDNTQAIETLKKEGASTNRAKMNAEKQVTSRQEDLTNDEIEQVAPRQEDLANDEIEQVAPRQEDLTNDEIEQRERVDSGYTTQESENSRENSPVTILNDHTPKVDIPPKAWNKANPDAAIDADNKRVAKVSKLEATKNKAIANEATLGATEKADKARADKIAKLEAGKNQAIVKPQKTGAEIAAKMEEQLKARKEASQSATPGRMDFSKMRKVSKGSGVGGI